MEPRNSRERLLGPALRTQPDRRLVALARDGSAPAQEEIVRRYRAALVRYAGSIVGAAAAEDVVQEALAKGLGSLAGADDDLRLRPWLYAIVRNTALNHLRDAGPATEQLDESYDGVEQPPQALERREGVRSLLSGLRGLPPQQREAIVKRELEGRSHEEIGAELGVSSGAARQLVFRAREALRVGFGSLLPMPLLRWLAEGGGGDAAVGAAAGAGGGALAAKAAVAVFAAGAAVTAGVAIDHGARQGANDPPAAKAAVLPAVALPGGGAPAAAGGPASEPVLAIAGDDGNGRRSGHSGKDDDRGERDDRERGDDSSGPGSGEERESDDDDRGERSGHRGSGDDDDRLGSSGSRHSGSGEDRSGSSGSRSGRDYSDEDELEADGSGSSGSGGDYADGDSSGSGSGGGESDEVEVEEVDFSASSPTAPVEATAIESDDDSSGSGGGETEIDD